MPMRISLMGMLLYGISFAGSASQPLYRDAAQPIEARVEALLSRHLEWVVEPGTFEVMLGPSSKDIRLKDRFEITGR